MIIAGVDPGVKVTGVVIAEAKGRSSFKIKHTEEIVTDAKTPLSERLNRIFNYLSEIILSFHPDTIVLEKLYSHYRHPATSIMLGHARGIVVLLSARMNVTLVEYSATQVKKAVTSSGTASKEQVKRMVSYLSGIDEPLKSEHIADALALIITYLHSLNL